MLISKRHQFIFFHVPKVAGSSITKAFRKYSDYPNERIYNYFIDYLGVIPILNLYNMHITPMELKEKMKVKNNFNKYYKFAFVRNPWDWHVSQFMYHKQNENAYFNMAFKKMKFSNYVEWAIQEENILSANARQKKFLSDKDGTLLVDFVGRFENLADDFEIVKEHLKISRRIANINPSKRKSSYREYYDDNLAAKIANAFEDDIKYFEYNF